LTLDWTELDLTSLDWTGLDVLVDVDSEAARSPCPSHIPCLGRILSPAPSLLSLLPSSPPPPSLSSVYLIPSQPTCPPFSRPDHLISGERSSLTVISSHPIPSHLISSHPIPSHLIPSHLIPSHPIPSHPISSHLISGERRDLDAHGQSRDPRMGRQRHLKAHLRPCPAPPQRCAPALTHALTPDLSPHPSPFLASSSPPQPYTCTAQHAPRHRSVRTTLKRAH
jgi:hypothetical protein